MRSIVYIPREMRRSLAGLASFLCVFAAAACRDAAGPTNVIGSAFWARTAMGFTTDLVNIYNAALHGVMLNRQTPTGQGSLGVITSVETKCGLGYAQADLVYVA